MPKKLHIIQYSISNPKISDKENLNILIKNLVSIKNLNTDHQSSFCYIFVDDGESDVHIQNMQFLQSQFPDFIYIKNIEEKDKVKKYGQDFINKISEIYNAKFILEIEKVQNSFKFEEINAEIITKLYSEIKQEINVNKIHIYKYKDRKIKFEKNIFKKIRIYFEK